MVESHQQFGPNVVSFQMASRGRRRYIVGCYLAPENVLTIESIFAAIGQFP